MKETEVIELLAKIRAIWGNKVPTEDPTAKAWCELLATVSCAAGQEAVSLLAKANPEWPPNPAQVYNLADSIDHRATDRRPRLPAPEMPADQRQRNAKAVHELIGAIGNRKRIIEITARYMGTSLEAAEKFLYAPADRGKSWGIRIAHHCDRCGKTTEGVRVNVHFFLCVTCATATRFPS